MEFTDEHGITWQIKKAPSPLTLTEAAGYLNVHPNTLKNWEKEGILMPSMRLPKRGDRRYEVSDLNKFKTHGWKLTRE